MKNYKGGLEVFICQREGLSSGNMKKDMYLINIRWYGEDNISCAGLQLLFDNSSREFDWLQ